MRCPTLSHLPPPPPGKTGWPWTEESPQFPDASPKGEPWPKISIITPSYNQGQFIEEAIRSVLLQGYPNLEYIIIDGGSTDNSVEIIKKYEPWLAYWISELDNGPYHAINKGLKIASGEIIGIINGDDLYEANIIKTVAETFLENTGTEVVSGGALIFRNKELFKTRYTIAQYTRKNYLGLSLSNITMGSPIINARFFKKSIYNKYGLYNTCYAIAADREFLIRLSLARVKNVTLEKTAYRYRQHLGSLTTNPKYLNALRYCSEHLKIADKFMKETNIKPTDKKIFRKWHSIEATKCTLLCLRDLNFLQSIKYITKGWSKDVWWPVIFITHSLLIFTNLLKGLSKEIISTR